MKNFRIESEKDGFICDKLYNEYISLYLFPTFIVVSPLLLHSFSNHIYWSCIGVVLEMHWICYGDAMELLWENASLFCIFDEKEKR